MYQSITPKQNMKGFHLTQALPSRAHQQTIPNKAYIDQNPSTPQKFSIMKNLKVLNIPAQSTQDSSFRSSSQKKLLTCESPIVAQQNKENGYITKRVGTEQSFLDNQIQSVIQENKKLNEMIQRQYKEKQELINIIEKLKQTDSNEDDFNLNDLRDRIDRLENIIDQQSEEIIEWKGKYKQACEQEDKICGIDQMESQIMQVVEENERLNNLQEEREMELRQMTRDIESMVEKQIHNESQLREQTLTIQNQSEEIEDQKTELRLKQNKIQELEELLTKLKEEEQLIPQSLNSSILANNDRSNQKDAFQLLEILQSLEQQLSELSTSYTYQVIENQKILRQNNALKDEIQQNQKTIDDLRGNAKGQAVNPKFSEVNKTIKIIRDKLVKSITKI